MELTIERVDLRALGDADLRAVYELEREIALEASPENGFYDLDSYTASIRGMPADWRGGYVLARSGGSLAGSSRVGWRDSAENRHIAWVELLIRASDRRLGIGRRLLGEAAAIAELDQRTLLMGQTSARLPAAEPFCRGVGAELGMVEHENRLEIPKVDRELVRSWLEPRPGYSLLAIDGATPSELRPEAARVLEVMNDAPRGELQVEDDHETPDQMAAFEQMIVGQGVLLWTLFARHQGSGALAGFTRVSWHPSMPAVVFQWGTAVEREHRGHGLGRWLKGSMLDRILRERPQAERILTTNATTNRWMLAINTELGFEPVSARSHWQVETAQVRYTSAQPARLLE